jgi:hypothetical protein
MRQATKLLALLATGLIFGPAHALAQTTFDNPGGTSGGLNYGIDVCRYWGAYCGQPVADLFCSNHGLGNATHFTFRLDTPPTWVIGDAKWCSFASCDRFGSITCGPRGTIFPTTYSFDNPFTRDSNDRAFGIDLCLNWAVNCGQPAADRYCQLEGYRSATQFSIRQDTPPTWVIGDNRDCTAAGCDRFQQIVCTR